MAYAISLDRSSAEELGVDVELEDGAVRVKSVLATGLVSSWNYTYPESQVLPEDIVVAANGISGDSRAIWSEMQKPHILNLTLRRLSGNGFVDDKDLPRQIWVAQAELQNKLQWTAREVETPKQQGDNVPTPAAVAASDGPASAVQRQVAMLEEWNAEAHSRIEELEAQIATFTVNSINREMSREVKLAEKAELLAMQEKVSMFEEQLVQQGDEFAKSFDHMSIRVKEIASEREQLFEENKRLCCENELLVAKLGVSKKEPNESDDLAKTCAQMKTAIQELVAERERMLAELGRGYNAPDGVADIRAERDGLLMQTERLRGERDLLMADAATRSDQSAQSPMDSPRGNASAKDMQAMVRKMEQLAIQRDELARDCEQLTGEREQFAAQSEQIMVGHVQLREELQSCKNKASSEAMQHAEHARGLSKKLDNTSEVVEQLSTERNTYWEKTKQLKAQLDGEVAIRQKLEQAVQGTKVADGSIQQLAAERDEILRQREQLINALGQLSADRDTMAEELKNARQLLDADFRKRSDHSDDLAKRLEQMQEVNVQLNAERAALVNERDCLVAQYVAYTQERNMLQADLLVLEANLSAAPRSPERASSRCLSPKHPAIVGDTGTMFASLLSRAEKAEKDCEIARGKIRQLERNKKEQASLLQQECAANVHRSAASATGSPGVIVVSSSPLRPTSYAMAMSPIASPSVGGSMRLPPSDGSIRVSPSVSVAATVSFPSTVPGQAFAIRSGSYVAPTQHYPSNPSVLDQMMLNGPYTTRGFSPLRNDASQPSRGPYTTRGISPLRNDASQPSRGPYTTRSISPLRRDASQPSRGPYTTRGISPLRNDMSQTSRGAFAARAMSPSASQSSLQALPTSPPSPVYSNRVTGSAAPQLVMRQDFVRGGSENLAYSVTLPPGNVNGRQSLRRAQSPSLL